MTKRKPHPIRFVRNKIDLSDWTVEAVEKISLLMMERLDAVMMTAVSQAIEAAFEDEETGVVWAAEWTDTQGFGDGNAVKGEHIYVKPLTMYLRVALGKPDHGPQYAFNLAESLQGTILDCESDGSYAEGLTRIAIALRELCDRIEKAVAKHSS